MKNIVELKKDVNTIEQFAINSLISIIIVKLEVNKKYYLTKEGYRYGAYIEVSEFGSVIVYDKSFARGHQLLKDMGLNEMIYTLHSISELSNEAKY